MTISLVFCNNISSDFVLFCPDLIHAQRDGTFKQSPDYSLGAPGGGQRALIPVEAGQVQLRWDELCQRGGGQRRIAV